MMKIIDLTCARGHVMRDIFVRSLRPVDYPECSWCGEPTTRAWLSAPSITPNGTRAERNTDKVTGPPKVDEKKIAADTMFEIEQKWNRFDDPAVAEQHVSREINEAAGIADERGNEKPIPRPDPIMFPKPTPVECGQ